MSEYFRKPIVKTLMLKGEKGETGDSDYKPAVDALGKRIDNLILSSGTESSAEVVDARTGYDGTAHDTLGTAIRNQISELKSDLAESGTKRIYPNYTLGKYIYPWGGTSVRDDNRFKLSEPFAITKGTKVVVKSKGHDNNQTIIAETNAEASSYKYLVTSIDGVYRDYEYIAPKDMYIAVSGSSSSSYPIVITAIERYKVYDIDETQVKNDILAFSTNVTSSSILADFNNAERNRIYLISILEIANMPVQEVGTLLCIGYGDGYSAQIYQTLGGSVHVRHGVGNGAWTKWVKLGDSMSLYDYASVSMFEKVGVIGDSYSSGTIWESNTESRGTFYNLSWCQLMARRNGITVTNYSKGGLSTRTWLTDNMGLSKLNSSEKENLYILALGLNDYYSLGMDYLGSISDIHDGNPSANADTFYGNYGRIIEAIKTKAPKAKIIMASIPTNESDLQKAFNEAILNISNHYSVPHIKLYNDSFINSAYYHIIGGHPNAVGYSGMCKSYERLIEECMTLNFDYFNDYTSEV